MRRRSGGHTTGGRPPRHTTEAERFPAFPPPRRRRGQLSDSPLDASGAARKIVSPMPSRWMIRELTTAPETCERLVRRRLVQRRRERSDRRAVSLRSRPPGANWCARSRAGGAPSSRGSSRASREDARLRCWRRSARSPTPPGSRRPRIGRPVGTRGDERRRADPRCERAGGRAALAPAVRIGVARRFPAGPGGHVVAGGRAGGSRRGGVPLADLFDHVACDRVPAVRPAGARGEPSLSRRSGSGSCS